MKVTGTSHVTTTHPLELSHYCIDSLATVERFLGQSIGSVVGVTKSVQHLTFSSAGGAGKVAHRLSSALGQLGWDSSVAQAMESDLRQAPLALPLHTLSAAVDNYLVKKPGYPSLISLSRDSRNAHLPLSAGADVYHLHWINGLSPHHRFAFPPAAKVVWTLHDMNPFTGGCHHSFDCNGFEGDCSNCPAVRGLFQSAVAKNLETKKLSVGLWPTLSVVSPSSWLATRAKRSTVMEGLEVSVVANPIDPSFLETPSQRRLGRNTAESALFVVIATDLDDPIKDVEVAVNSFIRAKKSHPEIHLLLIGQGGSRFAGMPGVELLGQLDAPEIIRVLDRAEFLVIPSRAENSPSVAYEAAARGVIPLVRNTAGLPEVVSNLQEGYVFEDQVDLEALVSKVTTAPRLSEDRIKKMTSRVRALCSPEKVAQQYAELYEGRL